MTTSTGLQRRLFPNLQKSQWAGALDDDFDHVGGYLEIWNKSLNGPEPWMTSSTAIGSSGDYLPSVSMGRSPG